MRILLLALFLLLAASVAALWAWSYSTGGWIGYYDGNGGQWSAISAAGRIIVNRFDGGAEPRGWVRGTEPTLVEYIGYLPAFDYGDDRVPGGARQRSVTFPHWLPFCLFSLLFASLLLLGYIRLRRLPANHCSNCGYDLRASSNRCPECGRIVAKGSGASDGVPAA